MKLLEKSKIHKDRIPADYAIKAKFVYDLFNFQTVYDPRKQELT